MSDIVYTKAAVDSTFAKQASPAFTGGLGLNGSTSVRQPIMLRETMNGPTVRAESSGNDKIALSQQTIVTGDFTGDTGGNAGFLWGQNVYLVTGSTPGDGKGITSLTGGLIEAAVSTPAGTTFPLVQGMSTHVSLSGASAGATITQAESLRVAAPMKKDGAVNGTIVNAVGLFVENVSVGSSSNISLLVEGGLSRFQGPIQASNNIYNIGGGDMSIYSGSSGADGGVLGLASTANGGHVSAYLPTANSFLFANRGGAIGFAANGDGLVGVGTYPDGGGGAGTMFNIKNVTTAPGGTPTNSGFLYVQAGALKYKGSSGTVTTIAAA